MDPIQTSHLASPRSPQWSQLMEPSPSTAAVMQSCHDTVTPRDCVTPNIGPATPAPASCQALRGYVERDDIWWWWVTLRRSASSCLPAPDPGCWWCDDARVKRFWCPGPGPGSAPLQGRVSVPGWGESRLVPAQRHISATAWTQLQHSHSSQLYTATADQSARGLKSPAVHIKSPRTYSVLKYTE